jgi:hypothetical protein
MPHFRPRIKVLQFTSKLELIGLIGAPFDTESPISHAGRTNKSDRSEPTFARPHSNPEVAQNSPRPLKTASTSIRFIASLFRARLPSNPNRSDKSEALSMFNALPRLSINRPHFLSSSHQSSPKHRQSLGSPPRRLPDPPSVEKFVRFQIPKPQPQVGCADFRPSVTKRSTPPVTEQS